MATPTLHDGHTHSHVPQGDITLGSLMALGASGGLVPCPAAMVLLLSAIAIGRIGLGLVLLIAFSLGLAGVLMAIGMLVIHAKSWLPESVKDRAASAFDVRADCVGLRDPVRRRADDGGVAALDPATVSRWIIRSRGAGL